MEEIYLLNSSSINLSKIKPVKCRYCNALFVVVNIQKVPEEPGEYHYEASLHDANDIVGLHCPYCGGIQELLFQKIG